MMRMMMMMMMMITIIIIIIITITIIIIIVPHSWVEKSIELVGVNSKIVRFCKLCMDKWNTRLFF